MTTADVFREELARIRERPARPDRRPILAVLAVMAARLVVRLPRARTALLSIGGFGSLTAAAWSVSLPAGLAAAGLSLLVLEYLADDGPRR